MSTPITQVTQLQMRHGLSTTLPGAPITLSPLTFNDGLETGELGFTTDTNQLFIGAAPDVGQTNYQRILFPYQNLEVLTEASPTLPKLIGASNRLQTSSSYYRATLAPVSTWKMVPDAPVLSGPEIAAKMEFFAYDGVNNAALRQGTIRIISVSGQAKPTLSEDSLSQLAAYNQIPPQNPPLDITFGFQFLRQSTDFVLQYVNNLSHPVILFFAFSAPTP